mmetsp:Transcript_16092/g.23843  ORF Transcript_16092/g.23843 Transcript_16092/m.23843 type:complete len:112 (+) Transcript_16092:2634-2969(+)
MDDDCCWRGRDNGEEEEERKRNTPILVLVEVVETMGLVSLDRSLCDRKEKGEDSKQSDDLSVSSIFISQTGDFNLRRCNYPPAFQLGSGGLSFCFILNSRSSMMGLPHFLI